MSDREIDEILKELKQRSQGEAPKESEKEETFSLSEDGADEVKEAPAAVEPAEAEPAVESAESVEDDAHSIFESIIKELDENEASEDTPEAEEEEIITIADEPEKAEAEEIPEAEAVIADEAVEESDEETDGTEIFEFTEEPSEEQPAEQEELLPPVGAERLVEEGVDLTEEAEDDGEKKNKKPLIIAISVIAIIAIALGIYFGFFHKKPEPEVETTAAVTTQVYEPVTEEDGGIINPLTGETGFNEAAVGKRPAAVVVENEYSSSSVRPQWGIEEADMIMEGETEYSTRMLFFWADYTNMPKQIGPTRSARPPFIRFSQLFDSIFIHAGLSHSKGNYVGADSVFESDNVDHINLLSLSEGGTYFGRDKSRTSTIEHTGYLNGTNAAELISKQNFRTDINSSSFTQFEFNKKAEKMGETVAEKATFKWSDRCPKTAHFSFNSKEGYYMTSDFDSNNGEAELKIETLIFLLDQTEYIVKENYKGTGNSETYCNYNLSGGKGMIVSEGTAVEINWDVEDGKLVFKTADGKDVKLNPGKIYIGYGSSNHGGSYSVEAKENTEEN